MQQTEEEKCMVRYLDSMLIGRALYGDQESDECVVDS